MPPQLPHRTQPESPRLPAPAPPRWSSHPATGAPGGAGTPAWGCPAPPPPAVLRGCVGDPPYSRLVREARRERVDTPARHYRDYRLRVGQTSGERFTGGRKLVGLDRKH